MPAFAETGGNAAHDGWSIASFQINQIGVPKRHSRRYQ
jgi:hypothetical protein